MDNLENARLSLKIDKMNDILEYLTSIINRILILIASINKRLNDIMIKLLEN